MQKKINIINNSEFKRLPIKSIKATINNVFAGEEINQFEVNVIYVDSDFITDMNIKYLNHTGDTDVITFPLNDEDEDLFGEIYICVNVAIRQADEYKVSLLNELNRLAAHGALHLCGYDDNTTKLRNKMSELETKYINCI